MAKPTKRRVAGGRVTPKGTGTRTTRSAGHDAGAAPAAATSGRYTAPTARAASAPSPLWVPVLMFGLLALGALIIVVNYVAVVLPGATHSAYLWTGLALILGGIITATKYR